MLGREIVFPMAGPCGTRDFCYDNFLALHSHVCHHLQTPRTAARPSSLRSVPSGLPMTMVNTQKNAAVHANSNMAILKKGDSVSTRMDMPMV